MIEEKTLRETLAENLTYYRKKAGYTQAELAAALNYSDKSVSKWERGDGVPDVIVLAILADCYGISVNDLLTHREDREPEEAPEETPKMVRSLKTRILVPLMSVGIAWLFSTFLFFLLKVILPDLPAALPIFTWCIPVTFIVLTVFAAIWWNTLLRFLCISGIVWSLAMCFFLTFSAVRYMSLIFAVAGVMEILVILWFIQRAKAKPPKSQENSPPNHR